MKKKILIDELLKGSIILFIMINIFNVLNYLYHFLMARFLGPSDYGELTVLISLVYIFAISSETIQNVIASYTSKLNANKELGKIKYLLIKSLKKSSVISLLLYLLFIPVAFLLSYFLKIDVKLFLITGLFIFLFFLIPILRGILQGQKKFIKFGVNLLIEGVIKIVAAVVLVILGFKVYGALFGFILGTLFSFILAFPFIKDIILEKTKKENFKSIYTYSIPYLAVVLSVTLMYSLDIILAKRFFPTELVGKYAAVSTLGKMIFFGTSAIIKAMFPISTEKHEIGQNTHKILINSLKISLVISVIVLIFYLVIPELIITILFGQQYIELANLLFLVGLSFTFLSFTYLILFYGLSIDNIKNSSYTLLVFVIMGGVLLSIFNESILEFSIFFAIINFLMLIYSLFLIKDDFNSNSSA